MITVMIWRMERRSVVTAMAGGIFNMPVDETSEAILAEVTKTHCCPCCV